MPLWASKEATFRYLVADSMLVAVGGKEEQRQRGRGTLTEEEVGGTV